MAQEIPIRNIYYLLCYAWNRLPEGELVDVSSLDTTELADLLATVLINGSNNLLRKGLDCGYESIEEELPGIRGKVDVVTTVRRMLINHGKAFCNYDVFNVNTQPNRILKSSLRFLAGVPTIDKTLRKKLLVLHRDLGGIDDIQLTKQAFRKVQLHANNRFYRFLLNVCELIQGMWMVDETTGKYKFREFIRDKDKMAKVFEDFVFNFYKIERPDLQVKKDRIYWDATSDGDPDLKYLPTMETDISLRSKVDTTIIDTKYYKQTLQTHFDSVSVRSAHLYQLFAYLKNIDVRGGRDANVKGILLYPVVDKKIDLTYDMMGHAVKIYTVDLSQDWKDIKRELLDIIN